MRVAIISDSHFDETKRFEECCRLHHWIHDDASGRGISLTVLGGDLYERRSTPEERRAAAEWITSMAELAPVAAVRGNHDVPEDVALLRRLRTEHPVIVEERAAVHIISGAAVACMAWPRKADVLAWARERGVDAGALAAEHLRAVLTGLGAEVAQHPGPRILLAHAMVSGAVAATGQPLVGSELEVSLADLALAQADFVALGHIHRGQGFRFGDVPMVYAGSPRRTDFGMDHPVGYVVANVERGHASWEFIGAPSAPMLLIDAVYDPEAGLQLVAPSDVSGAEIRIRTVVDVEYREAAKAAVATQVAAWLECGAVLVQPEERVSADVRARAPEVAAAHTLREKLCAYWAAKGFDPGDRRERLLGKLAEIEGGAA